MVVVRPPGEWGLYHRFRNDLFDRVLEHVASEPKARVVFLPRLPHQAEDVQGKAFSNVCVPSSTLDGPNLLYRADLVISGGGTMNREAAVLGTPAYSVFQGRSPAVDRLLAEQGRLRSIASVDDISSIRVERKRRQAELLSDPSLVPRLVEEICRTPHRGWPR
jgi:predicted glycosyltransferase